MKTKNSGAAAKTKAPAKKAIETNKPSCHSLVLFESLQLPGTPVDEAGPACVVFSGILDFVNLHKEALRIAMGYPSRLSLGGVARISNAVMEITRHDDLEMTKEEDSFTWDETFPEMKKAGLTDAFADRADAQVYHFCGDERKDRRLGYVLEWIAEEARAGLKPRFRGSVMIIKGIEDWAEPISLTPENVGNLLASFYGQGAVYFASEPLVQEKPVPRKARTKTASTPPQEKPAFDTNSDPDDDLPGDEWKKA